MRKYLGSRFGDVLPKQMMVSLAGADSCSLVDGPFLARRRHTAHSLVRLSERLHCLRRAVIAVSDSKALCTSDVETGWTAGVRVERSKFVAESGSSASMSIVLQFTVATWLTAPRSALEREVSQCFCLPFRARCFWDEVWRARDCCAVPATHRPSGMRSEKRDSTRRYI